MRDVIQKVLETEREAKSLVETAKADAEDVLAKARQRAREMLAQAQQNTQAEARRMVEEAMEAAKREKQENLVRSTAAIKTEIHLDQALLQRTVQGVVRCVCGKHHS